MIVELKSVGKNHAELCQKACEMMDSYEGAFCMESFDPFCVQWLRRNRPDIIRGQLSCNFMSSKSKMNGVLRVVATHQLFNVLGRPDFVAYGFKDRKTLSNWIARKLWGVQGVTWTLRTKEDFDIALKEGWIPIFENFEP